MFRRPGSTAFYKEKKQNDKINEPKRTSEELIKLVTKLAIPIWVGTLKLKERDKERLNEVKSDLRKLMDGESDG